MFKSQDALIAFIRNQKNVEEKSMSEITKILRDKGHRSTRTGKPLTEPSVRYLYYYGLGKRSAMSRERIQSNEDNTLKSVWNVVVTLLETPIDAESKIKAIIALKEKAGL